MLFICLLIFAIFAFNFIYFAGKAVGPPANAGEIPQFGPSAEETACLKTCGASKGCKIDGTDVACMEKYKDECSTQCNVKEETVEQKCVSDCAKIGCTEFDFECQKANQAKCDKQCGMIKAPDESTMSEEQKCITECVNKEAPGTICGASQTGETGNELCQRCAKSCENLYAGPCLGEPKLSEKKKACETCEHCYGEPQMGPSGEGWECIVDVVCKDASSEFGDEPGKGPGIAKTMGNAVDGVVNFVKNLFEFGSEEENPASEPENTQVPQ